MTNDFTPANVTVQFHSFIHLIPKMRRFSHTDRMQSSYLCILKGSFRYSYEGGSFTAQSGSLIYLPRGASYTHEVLSDETDCLQVEFDFYYKGSPTAFSKIPLLAASGREEEILSVFRCFGERSYSDPDSTDFYLSGLLFQLTSVFIPKIRERAGTKALSRISPALSYLAVHYAEPLSVGELAQMCYLSSSQLTRLFEAEVGLPPLSYKRKLLLTDICNRLRYTYGSVSEIAEAVGFSSVSSFSRFFKTEIGLSPREYLKEMRGT